MPEWQAILSRDGPAAWKAAHRVLGNRTDTDDCFQEACLAAVEVSRRQEVKNWAGLLVRLAVARAIDRLRAKQRLQRRTAFTDLKLISDGRATPPEDAEEDELVADFRSSLARIPSRQAEAFCLHCLEDWSHEQIAQFMSLSRSAVGVLVHRARQRLRTLMGTDSQGRSSSDQERPPLPTSSTDLTCAERKPS